MERPGEEEAKQECTSTGRAAAMGAAFTSAVFAAILASELSPTQKRNYVAEFVPALFAATIGYVVYFGVTGATMLGRYELPTYEFRISHLLLGILLGALATCILFLFALIRELVTAVLVNSIFPDIPIALSVGALLAAVPGSFLGAPVFPILIAAGTIGLGVTACSGLPSGCPVAIIAGSVRLEQ